VYFVLPGLLDMAPPLPLALPEVRHLVYDPSHHLELYDEPRPYGLVLVAEGSLNLRRNILLRSFDRHEG